MARLTVVNIGMELPVRIDDAQAAGTSVPSFDVIVAGHELRVRRLAHRLLGWREDASDVDDVVQDVFLAALKNLGGFRGEANLATWLTRVTINRCRTHGRKKLLRLRWLRHAVTKAEAPGANDRLAADETSAKVRQAVQTLPPRDREVIVLFYLEELPAVAIAALLNLTENAVSARLHRARQRLKSKLAGLADD